MTTATPDQPDRYDLAVQEAAAAICPASHRRGGSATEPPCGACYTTADTVIDAYQAYWEVHR